MMWKPGLLFAAVLSLALVMAGSAMAQTDEELAHEDLFRNKQFPSAFECKPCHELQFRQWSVSSHAMANLSPFFVSVENSLKAKSNGTSADTCSRCHAPLAAVLK
ncbi:MAG: multiheme c-type cytochrome, partial [Alphaproteobacteria bacterium]|nr:multiheme c-type cytochrome [Alphaproteobacteria bacterium]